MAFSSVYKVQHYVHLRSDLLQMHFSKLWIQVDFLCLIIFTLTRGMARICCVIHQFDFLEQLYAHVFLQRPLCNVLPFYFIEEIDVLNGWFVSVCIIYIVFCLVTSSKAIRAISTYCKRYGPSVVGIETFPLLCREIGLENLASHQCFIVTLGNQWCSPHSVH